MARNIEISAGTDNPTGNFAWKVLSIVVVQGDIELLDEIQTAMRSPDQAITPGRVVIIIGVDSC